MVGCGKSAPPPATVAPTAPAPATTAPATSPATSAPVADAGPAPAADAVAAVPEEVAVVAADVAPPEADAVPVAPVEDAAPVAPVAEVAAKRGDTADAVCAVIAAKTERVLADLKKTVTAARTAEKTYDYEVDKGLFAGCVGDGPRSAGTWAMNLESARFDPEETDAGMASITFAAPIEWIDADGTERRVADADPDGPAVTATFGLMSFRATFVRTADFDGDGRPELVVEVHNDQPDHHTTTLVIYRATATTVERWSAGVVVSRLEDIDGDGVLDLLNDEAFALGQGMNTLASDVPGVTHVAAGGKLEAADDAVKAYYLKRCPKAVAAADIKHAEEDVVVHQAACAWLWGAKGADLAAAVSKALVDPKDPDASAMEVSGPWSEPDAKPPVVLH
ncbi:MAG: VCBS repeat-containing protein [Myxococcota bacterium]